MSYFTDGIVYVIVTTTDITNEMENSMKSNANTTKDTARKSLDGALTVCKLKEPISNAFNGYVWFNKNDIKIEMAKVEWSQPVES